ncbi:MAG: helix-turn-helix domain-containing protein, partial [Parcubacteria group bacterium]
MALDAVTILKKLGLSETEGRLYLELLKVGALTANELTKLTHTRRPTTYYALRQLAERGLLHKSGVPGTERFQAELPEKILTLVTLQERELERIEKDVRSLIPQLVKTKAPYEGLPAVSFFQGDFAMKQAIMETLYARSSQIDSLTPSDNFFWQIGQTFSAN